MERSAFLNMLALCLGLLAVAPAASGQVTLRKIGHAAWKPVDFSHESGNH